MDSVPETSTYDGRKKLMLESLDFSENNIFYIDKIVADLQDYSKKLNPSKKEIDMKALYEKSIQRKHIPEGIEIIVSIDDNAQFVYADVDMLLRVLNNLGLNAAQAMPNGGKVYFKISRNGTHSIITVEDSGGGIPNEIRDKLFTPMFTTKSKGQGLGLAVVKRMIEAQGGTVSFESQLGKGTKFTIELPLE